MSPIVWIKGDDLGTAKVGMMGDTTVIEWPNFARVVVSPSRELVVERLSDSDDATFHKFEMGLARAVVHYLHGAVVLHASAVAVDGRALVIVGDSGAGKSTTAASLCRAGAALVADDCVVCERHDDAWELVPLEDTHWLDEASCRALGMPLSDEPKSAIRADRAERRRTTLAAVVSIELDDAPGMRVERCHGVRAARSLLDSGLRIPLGHEQGRRDFDLMARLVRSVPVFRMQRGRGDAPTLALSCPELLLPLIRT